MTTFCDAHNHLQDKRLELYLPDLIPAMHAAGITKCVVNGTCQEDWPRVIKLAHRYPDLILPSLGLHPWHIATRSRDWVENLEQFLAGETDPVFIGECGLDRSARGSDFESQKEIFTIHLTLASKQDLPLSIHCVRAWGALLEILRTNDVPKRGFLLHSYGGSPELVTELVPLGAYFSFSGPFLVNNRPRAREILQRIPPGRLLAETDAPDMCPPEEYRKHQLEGPGHAPLNHPANLPQVIRGMAEILDDEEQPLRSLLLNNFLTFFQVKPRTKKDPAI